MDAAMLTMIAALLVAVLASARDQHRLAVRTGEKLDELNSKYERLNSKYERLNSKFESLDSKFDGHKRTAEKQHEQSRDDLAEHRRTAEKQHEQLRDDLAEHKRTAEKQHEQLRDDLAEHKRTAEKNHAEVTGSLGAARERLARIEGHLRIGLSPAAPPEPGQ